MNYCRRHAYSGMLTDGLNERSSWEKFITVSIFDVSCEMKKLWSKIQNIAYAHMFVFACIIYEWNYTPFSSEEILDFIRFELQTSLYA